MIDKSGYYDINGKPQYLSIRADAPGLPLLLYLHGGPGDAALPLVCKYNAALQRKFTVVVWEQRGAGKSYYPFTLDEHLTMQTFLNDIHTIVTYLVGQFGEEKVYLLGHSWGSALGMKYIQQHSEMVHTYIGCGQVVDMRQGAQHQCEYVASQSKAQGNTAILDRLSSIDVAYTQENWLEDLLFVTKLVVKYKGSLYGKTNYNKLVAGFLFSREYNLKDLLNREKGSLQSIQFLWPELMGVTFWDTKRYDVPVVFIEGRHDHHVSATLAKAYHDTIESSKRFYLLEQSCHFPQWDEPEKFNEIILSLV